MVRSTLFALTAAGGALATLVLWRRLRRERGDPPSTRVAFVGNSIIYYNDLPRLIATLGGSVVQDSCLRGGVNFAQLLQKGNGMRDKFGADDPGAPTVAALLAEPWDFVVMNDYTQAPARMRTRQASLDVLTSEYLPLLQRSGATPVLLQTWAYREVVKGSGDLGDTVEFTSRLRKGYRAYAVALGAALPASQRPRVAPVGDAFAAVHAERPGLWAELFHTDGFHPSPLGTYLEACVIHATIFGSVPVEAVCMPAEPTQLWADARLMQPHGTPPLRRPTRDECAYLRGVAAAACAEERRSRL
tara:strand:- start:398 stop:1303 length:906 start_codon:yes stop_codon:yes gene_type:complete